MHEHLTQGSLWVVRSHEKEKSQVWREDKTENENVTIFMHSYAIGILFG